MTERLAVSSDARQQLKDIPPEVNAVLRRLGATAGICHVYVPHTTGRVVINENAGPRVCADMLEWLDEAAPQSRPFRHADGNSPAHIKPALAGQSAVAPVEGGRLALGAGQGVFLAESGGPRQRIVVVSLVGDSPVGT